MLSYNLPSIGFLLAIACAITNVGMDVAQKKAVSGRHLLSTIVALRLTVFAFMTLLVFVRHLLGYPSPWQVVNIVMLRALPHFITFFLADSVLVALSAFLYYRALQLAPLSITVPFLAFTPVFLLLSGWFILRDPVSLAQFEAVSVVIFGSLLMYRTCFQIGWLEPLRTLGREPGSRYMLLVALILSVTNVLEKWLVVRSGNFTFAWMYSAASFILFASALLAISIRRSMSFKDLRWPLIALSGTLDGTTLLLQYGAFIYLSPVLTISFKRGGTILTVIAGWLFFKERQIADRLIAATIMVCGALMLYIEFTTFQQTLLLIATVFLGLVGPRLIRRAMKPAAALMLLLPAFLLMSPLTAQQLNS